jgi:hypothetical protein
MTAPLSLGTPSLNAQKKGIKQDYKRFFVPNRPRLGIMQDNGNEKIIQES